MIATKELLLIAAVAAVGVLHTIVPDHWVPITLLARERGWSKEETARAALAAGAGHVLSTLLIAGLAAIAGIAMAARFGRILDTLSNLALVLLGAVIALSAWREIGAGGDRHEVEEGALHDQAQSDSGGHGHSHPSVFARQAFADALYLPLAGGAGAAVRHIHIHRHGKGRPHSHWHDHDAASAHKRLSALLAEPPLHEHRHRLRARAALILILGSSPMVEGIPLFFAAAKYGASLLAAMAAVFATGTILTYVGLSVFSLSGLERVRLGPLERYGEVLSGALIALLGFLFALFSLHSGGGAAIAA